MGRISEDGRWDGLTMNLRTDLRLAYSRRRVEIAWLKAAYLAVFWFLGYGAILDAAFVPVRHQIQNVDNTALPVFVGARPRTSSERAVELAIVHEPRSALLVGFTGFNLGRDVLVFLPAPGDAGLVNYRALVEALVPDSRVGIKVLPPDMRVRTNDGFVVVDEDSGEELEVYRQTNPVPTEIYQER
jgi:hypothetical protein